MNSSRPPPPSSWPDSSAGFAVARYTKIRSGGVAFAAAGAVAARSALPSAGPARTAAVLGVYTAAMGGSHPLAKKLGAWPSVAAVSAATAAVAYPYSIAARTLGPSWARRLIMIGSPSWGQARVRARTGGPWVTGQGTVGGSSSRRATARAGSSVITPVTAGSASSSATGRGR